MRNSSNDGQFLVAPQSYSQNQVIVSLGSKKTSKHDARRVQINETEYILPPSLLYHSCEPNAYIDWEQMTLKALGPISQNDLVTYHYGTSEYDYSVGAFTCDCHSKQCVGYFSGFCNMLHDEQAKIIEYASPYIRTMYFIKN